MKTMKNWWNTAAKVKRFFFGGALGALYSPLKTEFRVWAPTADAMRLCLFREGVGGEPLVLIHMNSFKNGVWSAVVKGDQKGLFYTFRSVFGGVEQADAVDPYARAVGVNGMRGMVPDLAETDPRGWTNDRAPVFKAMTDAVIYEAHVRDFTIHPQSGAKNKGKFLGMVERGTRNKFGDRTGLDHVRDLGVTHVHLLPAFDFLSVDEAKPSKGQYNWGYDPLNYNTPEGSYSTNAADGLTRIREFKQMVMGFHKAGLRVVMDVVYNHTGRTKDSHLNLLAPGYYYRQDIRGGFSNGSGCGNETASERLMVRKLFVDSVVYWAREYHVDGFRFDLMGLHDIDTMNAIRAALDKVDSSILLYGEGWTGGESPLPEAKRAIKKNAAKFKRIAAFSDDIRDGVKGAVWDPAMPGFVNGRPAMEDTLKFSIVAATRHPQVDYKKVWYSKKPWADEPFKTVQYVSCHDNFALWDKLKLSSPTASEQERIALNKLCAAIIFTAQGIPFIHAGEEFLREKKGCENSYNQPDAINRMDWARRSKYRDVVAYYRGLMALRKSNPSLRMTRASDIRKYLAFLSMPQPHMVGFLVMGQAGAAAAQTLVIHNANPANVRFDLPEGVWSVLVNGTKASSKPFENIRGSSVDLAGLSSMVLVSRI